MSGRNHSLYYTTYINHHAGTPKQKYRIKMYNVFGLLRDQDYSNMIIEGVNFTVVITMKGTYKS